jgi:hypothetical protein
VTGLPAGSREIHRTGYKFGVIDAPAVAQVQADLPKRILRAFVARSLLESSKANLLNK